MVLILFSKLLRLVYGFSKPSRLSCVFYVLDVFVVSAPFFGLHLFFSFLPSLKFFSLHVVYYTHDCSCTQTWYVHVRMYMMKL